MSHRMHAKQLFNSKQICGWNLATGQLCEVRSCIMKTKGWTISVETNIFEGITHVIQCKLDCLISSARTSQWKLDGMNFNENLIIS